MQYTNWLFAVVAAASAAGCGGVVSGGGDGGTAGSGGGTTTTATGSDGLCPAAPPVDGDPCVPPTNETFQVRAQCTWGDDPRPECRVSAVCQPPGKWSVGAAASTCADPLLPAECEATPPASNTIACAKPFQKCWYDDGTICDCSECEGGTQYPICTLVDPPMWWCGALAQGCPAHIPDAGTPCSEEGKQCGPSCELPVICEKGAWVWHSGNCPICASPSTPVATPDGDRPIADLRAGDLVYSVDKEAIVVVPILRADSTKVNRHKVVRVTLDTGAVLEISPGHPTADGRTFADLAAGGTLDGNQHIVSADLVPYDEDRTYDILPDSDTGSYFAAGARIGSTLGPAERR